MNLTLDYEYNCKKLDQALGIGQVFDIDKRKVKILDKEHTMYFASFLTDSMEIGQILQTLILIKTSNDKLDLLEFITENLASCAINYETAFNKIVEGILSGLAVLIINGVATAIAIDVRNFPGRSIGEPENERVVRGSREGFTENLATNMALIRRKLKTGELRTRQYTIGELASTRVVVVYLENKVDQKALKMVNDRLNKVKVEELTMSDKALEELILSRRYAPYPLVRYTERPDTLSVHLYQGMFGIIVDTSPCVIIAPTTIFDHMQHAEEYRQTAIAGSYLRMLRFLGILISFLLVPIWFTLTMTDIQLPDFFSKIMQNSYNPTIILIQIILSEIGIELLRMASIHTPNALSASIGLIAGIIIGDIAVELGLFTKTIVLLGAISAIGSYITPSYELSLANKIVKIILILMIYFFKVYGLIIGLLLLVIYLATLKSFNKNYLYPLIPFNLKCFIKQFVRIPYKNNK